VHDKVINIIFYLPTVHDKVINIIFYLPKVHDKVININKVANSVRNVRLLGPVNSQSKH